MPSRRGLTGALPKGLAWYPIAKIPSGRGADVMKFSLAASSGFVCLPLFDCVSPNSQREVGLQRYQGFGFTPRADSMAGCMMNVSQPLQVEQAAQQRANTRNQMLANLAGMDRQQAARAADDAAARRLRSGFMHEFNQGGPSGFGMPSINPASCIVGTRRDARLVSGH